MIKSKGKIALAMKDRGEGWTRLGELPVWAARFESYSVLDDIREYDWITLGKLYGKSDDEVVVVRDWIASTNKISNHSVNVSGSLFYVKFPEWVATTTINPELKREIVQTISETIDALNTDMPEDMQVRIKPKKGEEVIDKLGDNGPFVVRVKNAFSKLKQVFQ